MDISAEQVRELRERSGAGLMDCKRALQDAGGDLDKAHDVLRKSGVVKAAKKAGRATLEGLVAEASDQQGAALLEMSCETDFVARTDEFQKWVTDLSQHILKQRPKDLAQLLEQPWEGGISVKEGLVRLIAKLGENMEIRRFGLSQAGAGEQVASYLHMGAKIGAVIRVQGKVSVAVLREVAMHIAALSPRYLDRSEVPADVIEKEKEILKAQPEMSSKPAHLLEKILEGKLNRFFSEVCLVDQPFIKDATGKKTVGAFLQEQDPQAKATQMIRFQVGGEMHG